MTVTAAPKFSRTRASVPSVEPSSMTRISKGAGALRMMLSMARWM
jgi:hypothetical protein